MDYLSQNNKIQTTFIVCYADWAPIYSNPSDLYEIPKPSSLHIDERTIRWRSFSSLKEARNFADNLRDRQDEWLAYIEIKENTSKVINKLK